METSNYRAEKMRSNMPSVQLRLAKIYAIDQFRTGITCLKATGFSKQEVESLLKEFLNNSFGRD
jgi:hypothetical protein